MRVPSFVALTVLGMSGCEGTCRVDYSDDVWVFMDRDRAIPMAGPYGAWDSVADLVSSDCVEPWCHVAGDSLYYVQRIAGFREVYARDRGSLSHCEVIETQDCVYELDTSERELVGVTECGLNLNRVKYLRAE